MENNPLWAELGKHWKLVALRGVAALVFGVLTLLSPALALTVLVLFWGAYALVDGAFALIAAFNMRSDGQFNWPLALVGVIGVAAGLVAFFWPQLTAIGLLLIIAGWALAMGIFQIVAAIRLRKSIQNEWWMILSGAISVLFGVLMIANPGAGVGDHQHAEQHRDGAREDHPPFVLDRLAQADRRDDLEDAHRQRPAGDDQEQADGGQLRPEERNQAGRHADHPDQRQRPVELPIAAHVERGDQGERSVHQRVGAPEQHQHGQRQGRREQGQDAEHQRRHAAQGHQFPVLAEFGPQGIVFHACLQRPPLSGPFRLSPPTLVLLPGGCQGAEAGGKACARAQGRDFSGGRWRRQQANRFQASSRLTKAELT